MESRWYDSWSMYGRSLFRSPTPWRWWATMLEPSRPPLEAIYGHD